MDVDDTTHFPCVNQKDLLSEWVGVFLTKELLLPELLNYKIKYKTYTGGCKNEEFLEG